MLVNRTQIIQKLQLAQSANGLLDVLLEYVNKAFPNGEKVLLPPSHQEHLMHSEAFYFRQAVEGLRSEKPSVIHIKDRTGANVHMQRIPLFRTDGTTWDILLRFSCWYPAARWKQLQLQQVADIFFMRLEALEEQERSVRKAENEAMLRASQAVHDTISQKLFFLSAVLFQMKQQSEPDTGMMEKRLQELQQEARDLIADLRGEKERFDPSALLKQTLEAICADRQLIPVFDSEGTAVREDPAVKEAVFYIGEELMANAAKHSGADTLHVSVTVNPVQWELSVKDNGYGIRDDAIGGFGLTGIRRRLEKLGGTLKLQTINGTEAIVTIPRRGGTWNVQTAFS